MHLPRRGRRARLIAIGYGILIFLWLSPEDQAVWPTVLLGAGLAGLVILLWLLGRYGGRHLPARYVPAVTTVVGAGIGLGTSLATVALMFFKDARHAHPFPDHPPGLLLAILERGPVWALAGGLTGLALGLIWLAICVSQSD